MDADLVVAGGRVVTPTGLREASVAVTDGRIVAIGPDLTGHERLDATGCWVVPGAVDPHVHLSRADADPVEGFADDMTAGTRAALTGGVTTVGQMSFPVADAETPVEALERDLADLRAGACSDFFLHPSVVVPDAATADDLTGLAAAGHPSLKTTLIGLDPGPDVAPTASADLLAAFVAARRAGARVLVHCEDFPLIDHATRALDAEGAGVAAYERSRPVLTERAAVERLVAIVELTGAPAYVVHISSAEALEVVRAARARGLPVTAETRPIYLALSSDRYAGADGDRWATMPPLRSDADVEALWAGLADGTIDTIGSDHAPWTLEQRRSWDGTLASLRKGVAELDTYYPLLVTTGVLTGRISVEQLVEVVAGAPARLFGLERKGRLEVGADADLVLLDPEARRVVGPHLLSSRAGHSPYDGTELRGWPRAVVARGDVVARDGVLDADRGRGRLVGRRAQRS